MVTFSLAVTALVTFFLAVVKHTAREKVKRAVTVAPKLHAREKAKQAMVRHTTDPHLPPLDDVLVEVAAAVARRGVSSARAMLDHLATAHPGYGTAAGKQWKLREALAFALFRGTMVQVTPGLVDDGVTVI